MSNDARCTIQAILCVGECSNLFQLLPNTQALSRITVNKRTIKMFSGAGRPSKEQIKQYDNLAVGVCNYLSYL